MDTNEKQISQKVEEVLEGLTATEPVGDPEAEAGKPVSEVQLLENGHYLIAEQEYVLNVDYRDGFKAEALADRYNTILSKYDYIVGDWGYNQLRLKGFYSDAYLKAPSEKKISFLEDYLYEYCNFGCAYFVLEKISQKEKTVKNKRNRRKRVRDAESPKETAAASRNETGTRRKRAGRPEPKKDFVIKETRQDPAKGTKGKKPDPKKPAGNKSNFRIKKVDEE